MTVPITYFDVFCAIRQRLENEFVQMMKKYPVTKCIYGHLHAAAHRNAVEGTINGIEYKLVSGDYLGFDPIKLHD